MTTTADPRAALSPARISRLDVPEVESLQNDAVRGFFTRQQREEGLTSNWFRALSLNEDDLGRLNAYLLPLLGTDNRDGLTAREREVLHLLAEGKTHTEIGERLSISPRTAETHRTNLMRKLGLHTHVDLIKFALKRGIISNG